MILYRANDGVGDGDGDGDCDRAREDGPVVVGFNGTPAAWDALRWAADEAGRRRAALEVVCCPADSSSLPETSGADGVELISAGRQVDDAARVAGRRGSRIRINATVIEGRPGDVLVDRSKGAVVLVLGRHESGATPTPDRESLSGYCESNAVCPVTVVDSASHPDHPAGRGRVSGAGS